MFRTRRNSQKPSEDFYADFKSKFPPAGYSLHDPLQTPADSQKTMDDPYGSSMHQNHFEDADHARDSEFRTNASTTGWRSPSSVMGNTNPNLANYLQDGGAFWPPTPGFFSAGEDLNGQIMAPGMGTPISRHQSESGIYTAPGHPLSMMDFHRHSSTSMPFQTTQSFEQSMSFAPYEFHNFDQVQLPQEDSGVVIPDFNTEFGEAEHQFIHGNQSVQHGKHAPPPMQGVENFRFRAILHTKTAMIRDVNEIPITYLNKSQAYTISIKDMMPQKLPPGPVTFRTHVRVSFEEDQQRARPDHYWQLWREGRGKEESRDGNLWAVEYVSPSQSQRDDRTSRVSLESQRLDGFIVQWSPTGGHIPECLVSLRFNFLSTDFSHSKGVKGIPLRLCAKTTILESSNVGEEQSSVQELCYCKIKLFRDHGAERKLQNDRASVEKNRKKIEQQIGQSENNISPTNKRRRSDSVGQGGRPTKFARHDRTHSMSSSSSGEKDLLGDDLHQKLDALAAQLTSQRDQSLLFLRGEKQDDPDQYPLVIPDSVDNYGSIKSEDALRRHDSHSMNTYALESPTPSSQSRQSPGRRDSTYQHSALANPPSRVVSNEWSAKFNPSLRPDLQTNLHSSNPQHLASPPDAPVRVKKTATGFSEPSDGWINAIGVDQSYKPPVERSIKPVACFYIKPAFGDDKPADDFHRAIYLLQRTLRDFEDAVASKCAVDASSITNIIRINSKGIHIKVDDEMIFEMPEGQDMIAEFEKTDSKTPTQETMDQQETYLLKLRY